jgi:hypothetical protein
MTIDIEPSGETAVTPHRLQRVASKHPLLGYDVHERVAHLMTLAVHGLTGMYQLDGQYFPHTMRGTRSADGPQLRPQGESLRYAAIVALGLAVLPPPTQKCVLAGDEASQLARTVAARAIGNEDSGVIALAAWAAAEVAGEFADELFDDLKIRVASNVPMPTVDASWALTAAIAAQDLGDTSALASTLANRLLAGAGPTGVFPHMIPAEAQSKIRRHVGCFADQVYPIQALSRWFVVSQDRTALAAANRCAQVIVDRQGPDGQWWWHYDVRDDSVVEGFPVYSVHQHAMAPMALHELHEVGGDDHDQAIATGFRWLDTHPEVIDELISDRLRVIWRKVGRREQRKVVRRMAALTTAGIPGLHLPLIDRVWPPGRIDYECRPYEFGWLLYAWAANDVVGRLGPVDHG